MTEIPIAPIKRIMKTTNLRVSDNAAMALEEILVTFAQELAEDAAKLAIHAGRKTITVEDVQLAIN